MLAFKVVYHGTRQRWYVGSALGLGCSVAVGFFVFALVFGFGKIAHDEPFVQIVGKLSELDLEGG